MYMYFVLNHPAHYHLFKNAIKELTLKGHECEIFARPKDVLIELMENDGIKYQVLQETTRSKKRIISSSIYGLIVKNIKLSKYIINKKPKLLIGTDWSITNVGRIFNIPSLVFNEDDTSATPENKIFYPLAKSLILPDCCDTGLWENKKITYAGYHELAYLHPNQFNFEPKYITQYRDCNKPYIIVRLVKLTASHDKGKSGLAHSVLDQIIELSKNKYQIFISFEGEIIQKYEKYKIKFNPVIMHHFLAGAHLVIGDSQTMIAEAAILGTPAVRINDFVGKLSYLDEIEKKYNLAFGYKISEQKYFILKIIELLNTENLKSIWKEKLHQFYKDKIDVTAFMVWFIENYPASIRTMKNNPSFQYNFR